MGGARWDGWSWGYWRHKSGRLTLPRVRDELIRGLDVEARMCTPRQRWGTCAQGKRAVRAEPQIWGRLKKVPDPVGFPMPGWELLDPESRGEP